jgi:hypothetical protein
VVYRFALFFFALTFASTSNAFTDKRTKGMIVAYWNGLENSSNLRKFLEIGKTKDDRENLEKLVGKVPKILPVAISDEKGIRFKGFSTLWEIDSQGRLAVDGRTYRSPKGFSLKKRVEHFIQWTKETSKKSVWTWFMPEARAQAPDSDFDTQLALIKEFIAEANREVEGCPSASTLGPRPEEVNGIAIECPGDKNSAGKLSISFNSNEDFLKATAILSEGRISTVKSETTKGLIFEAPLVTKQGNNFFFDIVKINKLGKVVALSGDDIDREIRCEVAHTSKLIFALSKVCENSKAADGLRILLDGVAKSKREPPLPEGRN